MSTQKDQQLLVFGYLREECPNLPKALAIFAYAFFNKGWIWNVDKYHKNSIIIQYNNNYQFHCNIDKFGKIAFALNTKPKNISSIFIYYDLYCKEKNFMWKDTALLRKGNYITLANNYKPKIKKEDDKYQFILYISILSQIKSRNSIKTTSGITINYNDTFEWKISSKQIFSMKNAVDKRMPYQICSNTFGRSKNWYLSLQSTNGTNYRLYLHLLTLPNKLKSIAVDSNINIIGLDEDFKATDCNIFACGDKSLLFEGTLKASLDAFKIQINAEIYRVFGLNSSEISGNSWGKYGIMS